MNLLMWLKVIVLSVYFSIIQIRSQQSPSFSYVGENIAITGGKTNYTFLVQLWYDEVQYYIYNSNQCGGVCGHYTQVM